MPSNAQICDFFTEILGDNHKKVQNSAKLRYFEEKIKIFNFFRKIWKKSQIFEEIAYIHLLENH